MEDSVFPFLSERQGLLLHLQTVWLIFRRPRETSRRLQVCSHKRHNLENRGSEKLLNGMFF